MKKVFGIFAAAVALAMCLCMASCGGSEDYDDITDAHDSEITAENEETGTAADQSGNVSADDMKAFEGIWLAEADNEYDSLKIDGDGRWTLYLSGSVVDKGCLKYEPEWDAMYAYTDSDGSGGRAVIQEDGRLYITTLGYFNSGEGMETIWYEDGAAETVEMPQLEQ